MTYGVIERRFGCPYCGEAITMLLDLTAADDGAEQSYVEDCEVCCSPVSLHFRAQDGEVVAFDARQLP